MNGRDATPGVNEQLTTQTHEEQSKLVLVLAQGNNRPLGNNAFRDVLPKGNE